MNPEAPGTLIAHHIEKRWVYHFPIFTPYENKEQYTKAILKKRIQTALGDTLLVDKTPSYTMHKEILNRCEMLFDNALYIHLTRNPYGMIKSFEESHLEYDWLPYITGNDDILNQIEYTRRQLAEMIWYISHENILDFTRQLPANRHFHIRFEDLLTNHISHYTFDFVHQLND